MEFVTIDEAISGILSTLIPCFTYYNKDNVALLVYKDKEKPSNEEYKLAEFKTKEELDAFNLGLMKGLIMWLELNQTKG